MESLETLVGEFRQFKRTQEAFNEKHSESMEQILVQVTKTNGRVNELDKFKEKVESLKTDNNVQKGKDAIIKQIWVAVGSVAAIILGYLISKL